MLFQADEIYSKAVVKVICTLKYGIKVLSLVTEADMMERIKQAQKATLANRDSLQMQILEKVVEQRATPKSPRKLFGKKKKKNLCQFF